MKIAKKMAATKSKTKKASVSRPASRYIEAVGRRKTAVARIRLIKGKGDITIENKSLAAYFPMKKLQETVTAPLERLNLGQYDASVTVQGGGIHAQAEAIRLGIARALVKGDDSLKKQLRTLGFLTRDPRAVERKKYGLKKARRAPQWSKR